MDRNGIIARYKELENEITPHLVASLGTALYTNGGSMPEPTLMQDFLWNWIIKALNIVSRTCGENSQHFKQLEKVGEALGSELTIQTIGRLIAIFRAAKEDFEKGFIFEIKEITQAEIFDDELDQAQELLEHNFLIPSAVIAGTVLESKLRWLCEKHSIPIGKLDKMNADLAKANVYNKNTHKKITAIAAIRNSAAHGQKEDFDVSDVELMILEVKNFTSKHEIT